jgi:hypothetical protein
MSFWQVILQVAINVVSNIATPSILKASKHAYLTSTRKLLKAGQVFCQSISKTYSLAAAKLKLEYFAENAVRGISFLVIGVCRVALVCFWLFLINHGLQTIMGGVNDALAGSQVDTCYCPTPTSTISTKPTMPGWQPRYLTRDCPQPYVVRRQSPARSVLDTTESPLVFDCSPARKGRKSKRPTQPCIADIPVSTGGYVFAAE